MNSQEQDSKSKWQFSHKTIHSPHLPFGSEDSLRRFLEANTKKLDPWVNCEHTSLEDLLDSLRSAMSRDARLRTCPRSSVIHAFLSAAELGLDVDVEGHLVVGTAPDGKPTCRFRPGYSGLRACALRAGVRTVDADVVFPEDTFHFRVGTLVEVEHTKNPQPGSDLAPNFERLVCSYAVASTDLNTDYAYRASQAELCEARKRGLEDPYGKKAWENSPVECARLHALRQLLSKRIPATGDLAAALRLLKRSYRGAETEESGGVSAADVLQGGAS